MYQGTEQDSLTLPTDQDERPRLEEKYGFTSEGLSGG